MGWLLAALLVAVMSVLCVGRGAANSDAKRLYDDLLSNYNRLIRPVGNNSDRLTVRMGLRLSQLIEVNLKNQIMTTNMWVEQEPE
ncbi:acetylcholine receptor subunit alpha-like 1 [Thrips palmi]|uniref:Acetylcholine receptor subunit alpha-like 1 n=1 Tax=Thrips palmi TaxID=161013 RepID=A0A6P8YT18_THRPL|nr:acetylcholine receptor subunit alpha-like 1 [Thrips palmi]